MSLWALFLIPYVTIGILFSLTQRVVYKKVAFVPDDPSNPKGIGTYWMEPRPPTVTTRMLAGFFWLPCLLLIAYLLVRKRLVRSDR